jgi:hypothetical protein
MVERQLPKLHTRVRFPSPAPTPRRTPDAFRTRRAVKAPLARAAKPNSIARRNLPGEVRSCFGAFDDPQSLGGDSRETDFDFPRGFGGLSAVESRRAPPGTGGGADIAAEETSATIADNKAVGFEYHGVTTLVDARRADNSIL